MPSLENPFAVSDASEDAANAAPLLAQMEALLREAMTATDAAVSQRVRDDLTQIRHDLLEIVIARHGGDRDAAVQSDDFDAEFRQMTAVINPPKKPVGRKFPGVEPKKDRER